jgi:signal transduction histidine kinase
MSGARQDKVKLLVLAMRELNSTFSRLEKSYGKLQNEVALLRAELERKEKILNAFFENLPMGVILSGGDGGIIYRNDLALNFRQKGARKTAKRLDSFLGKKFAGKIRSGNANRKRQQGEMRTEYGHVWNFTSVPVSSGESGGERLILIEDVTKKTERRALSERRRRLQSLGETAAQVAHQIRNPLGSMELYASMLSKRLEDDPDSARMLGNIRAGLGDIETSVSNFLMFAAPPSIKPVKLMLGSLVEELVEFIRPVAESNGITLSASVPDGIELLVDGQMVKQLFLNLVMNSIQAMPKGGAISITARRKKGGVVAIRFADTGRGIRKKDLGRIFDPFFTTREKGTGLGLAISQNIAASHGGAISAASAPGRGAVFTVELKGR